VVHSYNRMVVLPMSYLSGKRFKTPLSPLLLSLREVSSIRYYFCTVLTSLDPRNSTSNPTTKSAGNRTEAMSPPSISPTLTPLSSNYPSSSLESSIASSRRRCANEPSIIRTDSSVWRMRTPRTNAKHL
jgi:hypothetical protein